MTLSQKNRYLLATVLAGGLLLGFMVLTRPSEDNLALSFVPLVFLWVLLYFLSGYILISLFKNVRHVIVQMVRIGFSSSITMLVMFSALGQLSVIDIVVLMALVVLGSFYFSRTWHA